MKKIIFLLMFSFMVVLGQDIPVALNAAIRDGYRLLTEEVKGIEVSSQTTVSDYAVANDELAADMNAQITHHACIVRSRFNEDGSCEVKMELELKDMKDFFDRLRIRIEVETLLDLKVHLGHVVTVVGFGPSTHEKARSREIALMDGYRLLAESIKGVKVTSNTKVRDYVASDQVSARLDNYIIRGTSITSTCYHPDDSCEIDMSLNIKDMENFFASLPVPENVNLALLEIQTSEKYTFTTTGFGSLDKKKVMARRAAVVDGYRQMGEYLMGIEVTSETTVKDYVVENDNIATEMKDCLLKNTQIKKSQFQKDGMCSVKMELKLEAMEKFLAELRPGIAIKSPGLGLDKKVDLSVKLQPKKEDRVIKVTGVGAPSSK